MPADAPTRKRGGRRKRVVDLEIWCPLSGVRLGNLVITNHKIGVFVCANGSLMGYCPTHVLRCFVGDPDTVDRVKQNYQIATM